MRKTIFATPVASIRKHYSHTVRIEVGSAAFCGEGVFPVSYIAYLFSIV